MAKFHVVLKTKFAGLPHNIRIETSADTEKSAINNALYHLRQHGPAAFNVPSRVFNPHLNKFRDLLRTRREELILNADPMSDDWTGSLDLRFYIPTRN